jgi:hypothetical protein
MSQNCGQLGFDVCKIVNVHRFILAISGGSLLRYLENFCITLLTAIWLHVYVVA